MVTTDPNLGRVNAPDTSEKEKDFDRFVEERRRTKYELCKSICDALTKYVEEHPRLSGNLKSRRTDNLVGGYNDTWRDELGGVIQEAVISVFWWVEASNIAICGPQATDIFAEALSRVVVEAAMTTGDDRDLDWILDQNHSRAVAAISVRAAPWLPLVER